MSEVSARCTLFTISLLPSLAPLHPSVSPPPSRLYFRFSPQFCAFTPKKRREKKDRLKRELEREKGGFTRRISYIGVSYNNIFFFLFSLLSCFPLQRVTRFFQAVKKSRRTKRTVNGTTRFYYTQNLGVL